MRCWRFSEYEAKKGTLVRSFFVTTMLRREVAAAQQEVVGQFARQSDLFQGLVQVGQQVVDVLNAD